MTAPDREPFADLPADLALDRRAGLPDALRTLLRDYPRDAWEAHPHFSGMVRFWLDRHAMFRKLTALLEQDTEAALDRRIAPGDHAARLSRFGGLLIEQLHAHHQVEDHHYFPLLVGAEPRLQRGFDILDRDHHAIDPLLARLAEAANGVIGAPEGPVRQTRAGRFLDEVEGLTHLLDRHLTDEEELVVPVILKHGPEGIG